MMEKKKVLFLCTHNAARSQMAEGLLRSMYGERFEAFSAGTEPASVHPLAIEVMKEIGIDISGHRSKSVQEMQGIRFDLVVTLCADAYAACPMFPGAKRYLHKGFEDPTDIKTFRSARDQIKTWIQETFN
jgi:arsenate reductase